MSSQSESTYGRYLTKKTSFDCIQTGTGYSWKELENTFFYVVFTFLFVMSFLITSLVLGIFKKKFHYLIAYQKY